MRPEDGEKFARAPVGSGPYMYKGTGQTKAGRPVATFIANPYYGGRSGRGGRPSTREIQFVQSPESLWKEDLQAGVTDLAVDRPVPGRFVGVRAGHPLEPGPGEEPHPDCRREGVEARTEVSDRRPARAARDGVSARQHPHRPRGCRRD